MDDDVARWARAGRPRACRVDPRQPLALPRLDWQLPARDLAPALVGRLPEAPPADASGDRVDFRDGAGRRWTAARDEHGPASWTLWSGDAPALTWQRTERGGMLSSASDRLQIRWREVANEGLRTPLDALSDAARALPECDDADLT